MEKLNFKVYVPKGMEVQVQEHLFKLGCKWKGISTDGLFDECSNLLFVRDNAISQDSINSLSYFIEQDLPELTVTQVLAL